MQYSVILALAATAVVATKYESGGSGSGSGSNSNWEISGPCSAPGRYRCHPSNTKIEVCAITGQYKYDWVKQADCGAQEKCYFREDNKTPYCLPKYSQGNQTDTGYTSVPYGGTGAPQTTLATKTRYGTGYGGASSTSAYAPYPTYTKGYGGYNSSVSAAATLSDTGASATLSDAASSTLSGAAEPTPTGTDDGEGEGQGEGEGEGEGSGDDQ